MKLRKTTNKDVDRVMEIIDQAKAYFKNSAINQWQDGYPNHDTIETDILNDEAFVLEENGKILGTCMITIQGEKTYDVIDGKWITSYPYLCIHRIAVDPDYKGKGLAKMILDQAVELFPGFKSLRMDTHEDNLSMQRFLSKYGFVFCGMITLENGDLRRAYEKVMN